VRKNKEELFLIFQDFINQQKLKAKAGDYDYDDDYKTFKMIYAIAELFPVNDKYYRNEPKAEQHLKELWYLYFFFKESIDGNKVKYSNIVAKYC
tara:strand:- start:644 stop:925 length:282 start_codon:yes stop_codon:yes gene_type:complete